MLRKKISRKIKSKLLTLSLKHKIILLISIVATITPMVLVSLLASVYYYLGIESIFSNQIANTFQRTVEISRLYLEEHINSIKSDTLFLANDIGYNFSSLITNKKLFNKFLDEKTTILSLSDAVLLDERGSVLSNTSLSFSWMFEPMPIKIMEKAKSGEVYIEKSQHNNKVLAIIKMDKILGRFGFENTYLLVSRYIDPQITQHLTNTEISANTYENLHHNIQKMRNKVIIAFIILAAVIFTLAVIFAIKLAQFITEPINQLVNATKIIKSGDFTIRVKEIDSSDETAILAKAFNAMITTIAAQRESLQNAKQLIDERRQFIETVLSELSAGVIAIDSNRNITLYNNSALTLFNIKLNSNNLNNFNALDTKITTKNTTKNTTNDNVDDSVINISNIKNKTSIIGTKYSTLFPNFKELIDHLFDNTKDQNNIDLNNSNTTNFKSSLTQLSKSLEVQIGKKNLQLFVRTGIILDTTHKISSIVITFDDVSELTSAQRFKAWADIARRIAHEIKNPLTPIQLSIDRIQQKFSSQIRIDNDQFQRYLELINKRISDIKTMITQFVEFANISMPKISTYDLIPLIKEAVLLQQNVHPDIDYTIYINNINIEHDNNDDDQNHCYVQCDQMQIAQVLTNILKNAAYAIDERAKQYIASGCYSTTNNDKVSNAFETQRSIRNIDIKVRYIKQTNFVEVSIIDNGIGINEKFIKQIYEPYITTKRDGMGIGLSIVKKIIVEHGGDLHIHNIVKNHENSEDNTFNSAMNHEQYSANSDQILGVKAIFTLPLKRKNS